MTFDVIQNALGELQLIPHGDPVPDGWAVVAETSDAGYLDYMASLV